MRLCVELLSHGSRRTSLCSRLRRTTGKPLINAFKKHYRDMRHRWARRYPACGCFSTSTCRFVSITQVSTMRLSAGLRLMCIRPVNFFDKNAVLHSVLVGERAACRRLIRLISLICAGLLPHDKPFVGELLGSTIEDHSMAGRLIGFSRVLPPLPVVLPCRCNMVVLRAGYRLGLGFGEA